jgi:chaperone modulatory protein CbpM
MTNHLTEDEILDAVPGLTRARLVTFIETELVTPLRHDHQGTSVHLFRQVDCARVRLLCELADDLDLDDAALGVVIALIDQLHSARRDLLAIARALRAESPDVRARIGAAVLASDG